MNLKLEQYLECFINDGWDDINTIIESMTEDDLQEMGINKKGHRKKIMLSITKLKKNGNEDNVVGNDGDGGKMKNIDDEYNAEGQNTIEGSGDVSDTAK